MREPKFRGYSKGTNSWHYGFGWIDIDYTDEFLEENGLEPQAMLYTEHSPVECELKSMGEFTGLKDCNGKEIYEGDILEANTFDEKIDQKQIGKVEYNIGRLGYVFIPKDMEAKNLYYPLFSIVTCEVIGNIFEHLHLLGVEE